MSKQKQIDLRTLWKRARLGDDMETEKACGSASSTVVGLKSQTKTPESEGRPNSASVLATECECDSDDDKSESDVNVTIGEKCRPNWPSVWSFEKCQEYQMKYPWIGYKNGNIGCNFCSKVNQTENSLKVGTIKQGIALSDPWRKFEVNAGTSTNRVTQLSSLRMKIKKHRDSQAHGFAARIMLEKGEKKIETSVAAHVKITDLETENVFRTTYYIAKSNRPFSDQQSLVELQKLNGAKLGVILHSRFTATNIVELIAKEMRKKIVTDIVSSSSKLSVLIDEATTVSHLSVMTVNIKAAVGGSDDPIFIFLDLVPLQSQSAVDIKTDLIKCLKKHGFTEEYLQEHWIAFASDGASVMLGKKNGVAKLITDCYKRVFTWHCLNHRLELAVSDTVKDITAVNHFQAFMDSLYTLFSQSSKNQRELREASVALECEILKIGRILDVRWVASSNRSVQAVWKSFSALHLQFKLASEDLSRDDKVRNKYKGLILRLASPEFLRDLGLFCDVLEELSALSLKLQDRTITLMKADTLIQRTIRILTTFKNDPGHHMTEVNRAIESGTFKGVSLVQNRKIVAINAKQFIQSMADNLRKRLCATDDLTKAQTLEDLAIFDKQKWPANPNIRHGEVQVRRLCERFNVNLNQAISGMRELVEAPPSSLNLPLDLQSLHTCVKTMPCSTAECERTFSLMNIVCSDLRNRLLPSNISNLIFINMNGPPIADWNPTPYVKVWLSNHRRAQDEHSKKSVVPTKDTQKESLWKIL